MNSKNTFRTIKFYLTIHKWNNLQINHSISRLKVQVCEFIETCTHTHTYIQVILFNAENRWKSIHSIQNILFGRPKNHQNENVTFLYPEVIFPIENKITYFKNVTFSNSNIENRIFDIVSIWNASFTCFTSLLFHPFDFIIIIQLILFEFFLLFFYSHYWIIWHSSTICIWNELQQRPRNKKKI